MTKSFTPTEMHHSPAKVYRAAAKDGAVLITHDRHPDVVFVLQAVSKDDQPSDDSEGLTDTGVSKKLLREFNDAYNKQTRHIVDSIPESYKDRIHAALQSHIDPEMFRENHGGDK